MWLTPKLRVSTLYINLLARDSQFLIQFEMKIFFIALSFTLIFGCGGSDESILFACAACDKEYSKNAEECPNCGEPSPYETTRQIHDEVQKLKKANEPFMNKDGTLNEDKLRESIRKENQ